MITPKVWNQYGMNVPSEAVYVGRPTKWGNPYVIGRHGNREQVLALYEKWLYEQPMYFILEIQAELAGKNLVCWCAPLACHGDLLLQIANQ